MSVKRIIFISLLSLFLLLCLAITTDNIIENYLIHNYPLRSIFNFYLTDREDDLILLVGSSQVREDLDAPFIQSRLKNYHVYNLGYTGDMPSRRLMDLPFLLKLKPKVVVFGLDYFQVSGNYPPPLDDFKMVVDLTDYKQNQQFENFNGTGVNKVIEWDWLQKLNYRIAFLVPAINYKMRYVSQANKDEYGELRQPSQYTGILNAEQKRKALKTVFDDRFLVSEKNNEQKAALKFFLENLRKNGIKVIVVDMPNNPLLNSVISGSSKKAYQEFIRTEVIGRCDLYVSYKNDFDDSSFYDMTHMDKKGREVLTQKVYEHVSRILHQ